MLFVFLLSGSTRDFSDYELSTYWSLNLHGHFDSAQYSERCASHACSQPSKAVSMRYESEGQAAGAFAINDHQIDDVSSFPYLGSIITPTNDLDTEVNKRIGMAWGLFSRLRRLWRKRGIRIGKKIKVFNAMVTSTLLYASVMWTQREEHM